MQWFTKRQWDRVEDKSDLTPQEFHIFHATKEKLDDLKAVYHKLDNKLEKYMMRALRKFEATKKEIRQCKAEQDAILEELSTVHNMANRAQGLSVLFEWKPFGMCDSPDHWTDGETGLRLEVTPGPTHEWHSEWRERLLEARTSYGPAGPPPYPPFNRSPAWENRPVTRDHPHPLYWEPDSVQKLAWEESQQNQEQNQEQGDEPDDEEGTDLESEPEEAGPSYIPESLRHLPYFANLHRAGHSSALSTSPLAEQSNTGTQPSKRDKGKGKAVDPPTTTTESRTAPVAGPSSASAPTSASNIDGPSNSTTNVTNSDRSANAATAIAGPSSASIPPSTSVDAGPPNASVDATKNGRSVNTAAAAAAAAVTVAGPSYTSAPAPVVAPYTVSASTSSIAEPSIATTSATTETTRDTEPINPSTNIPTSTTTGAVISAAIDNTATTAVTKEETNQETTANDADKSTINVQPRARKIKIKTPANKKDIKGKGKAVDKSNNTNNNTHKITKPRIIKRSQVVKEKYWVFKLDSSMFIKSGRIRAELTNPKGNNKSKAKEKGKATVFSSANDNGGENGEGSSSMASSSKTATAINNGNDNNSDDNSEDELALGQDSDDCDSGSETDDSKDSNFTLTSKSKKGKVTTAAASTTDPSTTITTASSSHSSANKRKRTTTDTGDEEQNAYYVLRCPLDQNCMSHSNSTHNAPASIKGVFCRHPFKKRRAMDHIKTCGLQGELVSEEHIWKNCCKRVVPDRKNTPVNDEWAVKHNRTLIRSLVHKAGGGKEEKEKMEKEMEEEL